MQHNKLTIQINQNVSTVFDFTIDPSNTPTWISHLVIEETNEFPPKIGTIYRNHDGSEVWDEYSVVEFEQNKIFTLRSKDNNYSVRYTYTDLGDNKTEMEYYEWVETGELSNPFTQEVLDELKTILESTD
jgi:uncharacterized protein YndB with AHSA1/START domain